MKKIFISLVSGVISIIMGFYIVIPLVSNISSDDSAPAAVREMAAMVPLIYMTAIILALSLLFFAGKEVVRLLKWNDFGNRLKIAYVAKFGYENPAFNEEVNNHIRIMRTMSKGVSGTKESAEGWLKRMAHMVEIKYIIPEEEYLSETDKTEQLNDIELEEMAKWQKGNNGGR